MHPVFLKLGSVTIYWYGVFMALAFLAGLVNWTTLARREGRDPQFCSDLLFWVMLAGLAGGRLAYVLSNAAHYAANPLHVLFLWEGGLIYYGGFVGGILAVLAFARRRHIPMLALLDFAITALPLAHALGRVGCFMNGCCFGSRLDHWPAVSFPAGSPPWDRHIDLGWITNASRCSLPIHPVQLYETGLNLALYVLLLAVYRRPHRHGMVTATYFLVYPPGRFLLEFLRGTERLHVGALSAAQTLSVALIALGGVVLLLARRQPITVENSKS